MTDMVLGPVAVFGASGFIGRHVVSRLTDSGVDVIIPKTRSGGRLDISGPEDVIADSIKGAMVVLNAAGTAHIHGDDPSRFWGSNAVGAGNVAAAAVLAGAQRLVHISSVAVGSGGLPPHVLPNQPFTAYGASKAAGEFAVAAATKGTSLELVVVRPAGIGGIDSPGSWGSIRRLIEAGKRVPVPNSGVRYDVVEIAEVADFVAGACRGEIPPGVHAVTGRRAVTLPEYAAQVGELAGKSPRLMKVPTWVLSSAAASTQPVSRASRVATRVQQLVSTLVDQRPLIELDHNRDRPE